jgi:inner membrane transporter RhtA
MSTPAGIGDDSRVLAIRRKTFPPQAYFAGSAVFHYLGPAFAVLLFARVAPAGVAWLRIVSAAIVFAAWRRPWRALRAADRWTKVPPSGAGDHPLLLVIALGVVLAIMNVCFYEAIARLPLGTVSAIEFLPVILLAAVGLRSGRNAAALGLAVAGVYVLTRVQLHGVALGFGFAFANAALFALYIVLAHRISRASTKAPASGAADHSNLRGIDGLGAAMLVAAVAITPIGGPAVAPHLLDPVAIGAGIGVGISSSVIPYVCDQLAMARLRRETYSLMVSLLPATATVVGLVVLGQVPSARELVGVCLVVAAVAVHRDKAPPSGAADPLQSTAKGVAAPRPRSDERAGRAGPHRPETLPSR